MKLVPVRIVPLEEFTEQRRQRALEDKLSEVSEPSVELFIERVGRSEVQYQKFLRELQDELMKRVMG